MSIITRRQALKFGVIAGGSLLLPVGLQSIGRAKDAESPLVIPFTLPFRYPQRLKPVRSDNTPGTDTNGDFGGTDYYQMTMRKNRVNILPGLMTEVWAYNGQIPGPIIYQRKGRQSIVRLINNVGTPTSVHLHGITTAV